MMKIAQIVTPYPLLNFILRHFRLNAIVTTAGVVLILFYVIFVAQKQYTSDLSILPPTASLSSSMLGSLGDLGQLAGFNLGSQGSQSPEMYMGILKSRRVLEKAVARVYQVERDDFSNKGNLIHWLNIEGKNEREIREKVLKEMNEEVVFIEIDDDNSILSLSVTTPDPYLSAEVANYMGVLLNDIVKTEVQLEYRQQLAYLEEKLAEAKDSLRLAENELESFLVKNYDINIPKYQFENLRLQRNIRITTEIYIEFRKQYEIFVLENLINLSDVKVLDEAIPAYKKSRPKRALLSISLFIISTFMLLLGNLFALFLQNIRNSHRFVNGKQ